MHSITGRQSEQLVRAIARTLRRTKLVGRKANVARIASSFTNDLVLLASGARLCFLHDSFFASRAQLDQLLRDLKMEFDFLEPIGLMVLNSEASAFFFFHISRLQTSFLLAETASGRLPLGVFADVSSSLSFPCVIKGQKKRELGVCLSSVAEAICSQRANVIDISVTVTQSGISLSTLSGWLLDYPVVFFLPDSCRSTCLSEVPLSRFKVHVEVADSKRELCSFTCPTSFLENGEICTENGSQLSLTLFEQHFRRHSQYPISISDSHVSSHDIISL